MPKTMTLQCEAGHKWERPAQRGRPPRFCPKHAGAADPNSLAEQRRKIGIITPMPTDSETCPIGPGNDPVADGLRAALARPTDPGKVIVGTGKNGVKPRIRIHVSEVQVGDWTHVTGFRPVTAVKVFPRKREVRLRWSDGSSETFSFTYPDPVTKKPIDRIVMVYRPEQ